MCDPDDLISELREAMLAFYVVTFYQFRRYKMFRNIYTGTSFKNTGVISSSGISVLLAIQ